jgi:hypothetical protein
VVNLSSGLKLTLTLTVPILYLNGMFYSAKISSAYKCCNMHQNCFSVAIFHNTREKVKNWRPSWSSYLVMKSGSVKEIICPISIQISQWTISHQCSQLKLHDNPTTILYRKRFCTVKVHLTSRWHWHWPNLWLYWKQYGSMHENMNTIAMLLYHEEN